VMASISHRFSVSLSGYHPSQMNRQTRDQRRPWRKGTLTSRRREQFPGQRRVMPIHIIAKLQKSVAIDPRREVNDRHGPRLSQLDECLLAAGQRGTNPRRGPLTVIAQQILGEFVGVTQPNASVTGGGGGA